METKRTLGNDLLTTALREEVFIGGALIGVGLSANHVEPIVTHAHERAVADGKLYDLQQQGQQVQSKLSLARELHVANAVTARLEQGLARNRHTTAEIRAQRPADPSNLEDAGFVFGGLFVGWALLATGVTLATRGVARHRRMQQKTNDTAPSRSLP